MRGVVCIEDWPLERKLIYHLQSTICQFSRVLKLSFLASALQARSDRKERPQKSLRLRPENRVQPSDHLLRLECVQTMSGTEKETLHVCSELQEPSCLEPLVPPKRTAPLKLHRLHLPKSKPRSYLWADCSAAWVLGEGCAANAEKGAAATRQAISMIRNTQSTCALAD